MFSLNSKRALVIGGASGIGAAIASAFGQSGATVIVADRQSNGDGIAMDVTDWNSVRDGVERAEQQMGAIDVLVNSAGIMHVGKLHESTVEDYDLVQQVNARGVFLACRAVIEGMRSRGQGNIINIASVAGLIAVERRFSYCVSKGAVVELTRALAVDYAGEGIRANAICPGTVDTPMIRGYVAKYFSEVQEETIASLHARQPVGRMGRAEEVAGLAVYLASDESAFLTGAALPIDGGWTAK